MRGSHKSHGVLSQYRILQVTLVIVLTVTLLLALDLFPTLGQSDGAMRSFDPWTLRKRWKERSATIVDRFQQTAATKTKIDGRKQPPRRRTPREVDNIVKDITAAAAAAIAMTTAAATNEQEVGRHRDEKRLATAAFNASEGANAVVGDEAGQKDLVRERVQSSDLERKNRKGETLLLLSDESGVENAGNVPAGKGGESKGGAKEGESEVLAEMRGGAMDDGTEGMGVDGAEEHPLRENREGVNGGLGGRCVWTYENDESDCRRNQGCNLLAEATRGYDERGGEAEVYRGAMWRAPIGRWLKSCDAETSAVAVRETLYGKTCPEDCNKRGVCNPELGVCRCKSGWKGDGCEEDDLYPCNQEPVPKFPFGHWIVTICAATCDQRLSNCICGPDTKYPGRQAAAPAGFIYPDERLEYEDPDPSLIYSNDSSRPGWCFADPQRPESPLSFSNCVYDGWLGRYCEIPVRSFCINQCSLNGFCDQGFCQCNDGWYGMDCSIPRAGSFHQVKGSQAAWPAWLSAASPPVGSGRRRLRQLASKGSRGSGEEEGGEGRSGRGEREPREEGEGGMNLDEDIRADDSFLKALRGGGERHEVTLTVQKKRPLVYIYDLPPEFHMHQLQRRHWRYYCTPRQYDLDNQTDWNSWLYGAETMVFEGLFNSAHRTTNPEEADYFFVPALGVCLLVRADDSPRYLMRGEFLGLRPYIAGHYYKLVYEHIRSKYPFWDRNGGKDHIWSFFWDEGACAAPKEIWNSIMLVHWGNTAQRPMHTSAYFQDGWTFIPEDFRGTHPCYDPAKDIVLPAYKLIKYEQLADKFVERPYEERPRLFYFNGNLGHKHKDGRAEHRYSWGIRQSVAHYFGSVPNISGSLGVNHTPDVIVTNERSDNYHKEISKSKFCGVFPGDGWSGRLEDAIINGCIPVIIQDGVHMPFENVLDYAAFAVRIAESDIPNMVSILRAIPEEEVRAKLTGVKQVWHRFAYAGGFRLEAKREQELGHVALWHNIPDMMEGDDCLDTLIQVLHYKLHNDEWRWHQAQEQRTTGHISTRCHAGAA